MIDCQFVRGDCLHVLSKLPSASVDSFVTDPPYGINLKMHWNRNRPLSIAGDGRNQARLIWSTFLAEAHRLAKPDTAHIFFGTWKSIWIKQLLEEHFQVKGCIVWFKNTWGMGYWLRPRWELAWLCHKGKPAILGAAPPDVWQFNRDHRLIHPCQKPVDLLRQAIRTVCPPGGLVADPFAGVASCALASIKEDRRWFGIEIDPRHHRLGLERLSHEVKTALTSRAARTFFDLHNPINDPKNADQRCAPCKLPPGNPSPVQSTNFPQNDP